MLKLTDGMFLYHGSFVEISKVKLEKCKQGKDFGRGFYVTSSYEQARSFVTLLPNRLEDQFCFCNEKAIQTLEFVRSDSYDINHK